MGRLDYRARGRKSDMSTETVTGRAEPKRRPARSIRRAGVWLVQHRESSVLVVDLLVMAYFFTVSATFLSHGNIVTLSQFTASWAVIGAGLAMVLICAEIDLSVGMTFAFAPIIMWWVGLSHGLPLIPSILIGLVAAIVVGAINGMITVYLRVHSFLTTLGMFFLLTGLNVTLTNGAPQVTPLPNTVTDWLGQSDFSEIIWALIVVAVLHVVLRHTSWGVSTLATGGNPIGASEAGINTGLVKIGNFMIAAFLAGFMGILEAFRIQSIDPLSGSADLMFLSVSAAVIGGTSLLGGEGTIIGALLGAVLLAALKDGFTLTGVSAFTFNIILGIAVLLAIALNIYVAKLRGLRRQAGEAA